MMINIPYAPINNNTNTKFLNEWTPAFKATDENMKCRDEQFELGKTYNQDDTDPIKVCKKGYHVCGDILSTDKYYPFLELDVDTEDKKITLLWNESNYRFFNVSIRGVVDHEMTEQFDKIAAEEIRFDSEIDMTNGTFTNGNEFIKVRNNKVHSDDGPAVKIREYEFYVMNGEVTKIINVNYNTELDLIHDDNRCIFYRDIWYDKLSSNAASILSKVTYARNTYNPLMINGQVYYPSVINGQVYANPAPPQYAHQQYAVPRYTTPQPAPFWLAPANPMSGFGVRYF